MRQPNVVALFFVLLGGANLHSDRTARAEEKAASSGVYVELRADNPSTRIDLAGGEDHVTVCVAPCRDVVGRYKTYVIRGDGVTPTSQFLLTEVGASVTLTVKSGSSVRSAAGKGLAIGGIATGVAGLTYWYFAEIAAALGSIDASAKSVDGRTKEIAFGTMTVGLAAAVIGGYLIHTGRTIVESSTGATFSEVSPGSTKRPPVALTPRGLEF